MFFKKILFLFLFLVGCSATEEFYDDITSPDYVNSSKAKRLEIPPDLSEIESNSSYNVPGEAKSYRDYIERENNGLAGNPNLNQKQVIANPDGMRIIKSGNLRWLLVEKEPDLIWPHVKDFWEDLGFRVSVSNKRTGIIETEWMDTDDIKLDQNKGALSTFDKWLDSLSGFADKRKFRTRVEIGENGFTEIYISQRSAEAAADQHTRIIEAQKNYNPSTAYKIEEYKSDESSGKKLEVSEQREIDDYEIDSELLTRLMIKLGASDLDAKKKVENPETVTKTELIQSKNDSYIVMFDPYDRAWRRLGLALDIIGFVTEDKNRSEGIYYVRFNEIELPKEKNTDDESIIDSLIFWGDDEDSVNDKDDKNNEKDQSVDEEILDPNEPKFTGIEAPEVKPIDEDYIPEDNSDDNWEYGEEDTWFTKIWPSWGDKDQDKILPDDENRYRIRIKPSDNNTSQVYLDYPNGKKNLSSEAKKLLTIINEYLK